MTPESLALKVGQTQVLEVRVLPEDASQDVTITVTDPDILRVENIEGGD